MCVALTWLKRAGVAKDATRDRVLAASVSDLESRRTLEPRSRGRVNVASFSFPRSSPDDLVVRLSLFALYNM